MHNHALKVSMRCYKTNAQPQYAFAWSYNRDVLERTETHLKKDANVKEEGYIAIMYNCRNAYRVMTPLGT